MVKAMKAAKTVTRAQDSEWLDMCGFRASGEKKPPPTEWEWEP